jgi:uncharacterized protein (DUF302 family)
MALQMNSEGLVTIASKHSVAGTINRLVSIVSSKGLTVFARIDHAKGARDAGLELRPTELLIFGQAKGGTPLMQDKQIAGLDLPLRALAWEDEHGAVWLSYHPAAWIASGHGLSARSAAAIEAIDRGLSAMCAVAVAIDLA